MRLRTSNENLSGSYIAIAIPLVAMITFVIGYTASRTTLSQTRTQAEGVVTQDYNLTIPHEATLWNDFAN